MLHASEKVNTVITVLHISKQQNGHGIHLLYCLEFSPANLRGMIDYPQLPSTLCCKVHHIYQAYTSQHNNHIIITTPKQVINKAWTTKTITEVYSAIQDNPIKATVYMYNLHVRKFLRSKISLQRIVFKTMMDTQ